MVTATKPLQWLNECKVSGYDDLKRVVTATKPLQWLNECNGQAHHNPWRMVTATKPLQWLNECFDKHCWQVGNRYSYQAAAMAE